uniref:Uncharacterized protein n=1 Tax=Tremella fuciformis TaxID=64657 RepID=D5KXZ6_9TREE|nr:unknown [Tremella fuciformis]
MLLTNLRAFPPSSVAHYRESQLRGDKWNNVLIAILYHPQVHICRLYADHCTRLTDTALDLEQALDHAFRNRYAEQYCASDQTFPSIDQITSQTQDVVTSSPDTLAVAATPVRSPKKRRRHASKSASIVSAHSSVSIAGAA